MTRHTAHYLSELVDCIGTGCSPGDRGPVAVEITLWDGRLVRGTFSKKQPDIVDISDVIWDDEALRPFVEKMLADGTSFVTETGEDDLVCTLEWTIEVSTLSA